MSSTQQCIDEFNQEIASFERLVFLSLGLTALSGVATIFFKAQLESNLKRAWMFYFGLSAIKLLLGILLFTAFSPTCPSGCNCGSYHPSWFYPTIVIVIGLLWLRRGKQYYDRDRNGNSSNTGGEGTELNANSNNESEVV